MYPFAEQAIGRDLCRTKDDIRNQPIGARRSTETEPLDYNWVRSESALGYISPKQFRPAGETGCGKDGRFATVENSANFPLFISLDGGDNYRILTFEVDRFLRDGSTGLTNSHKQ